MAPATDASSTAAGADLRTAGASGAAGRAQAPAVRVNVPTAKRLRVREVFSTLPAAKVLAIRDLQSRFKQSLFGPIWLVVQPLSMVAGFTIIFGSVAKIDTNGIPYALFSLIGVCVWTTFQQSTLYGTRCIVANKQIVKNIPFPRLALLTSSLLGSVPQFAFMLAVALLAVVVSGRGPVIGWVLLPLLSLWLFAFIFALLMPLASWHTRYRDVGNSVPFLFQAGLLLSPVAYPLAETHGALRTVLELNPLTGIIEAWRWGLLGGETSMLAFALAVAWTAVLLVAGWRIFARAEIGFSDVI